MSIVIKSYKFIKETFESEYNISIDILKDTIVVHKLKIPTNPILDNMIIDMNEESLQVVMNRLQHLIVQDEFGYTSRIELVKLMGWLAKICNVTVALQNSSFVDIN